MRRVAEGERKGVNAVAHHLPCHSVGQSAAPELLRTSGCGDGLGVGSPGESKPGPGLAGKPAVRNRPQVRASGSPAPGGFPRYFRLHSDFGMVDEANPGMCLNQTCWSYPSWMEQLDRSQQTRGLPPLPARFSRENKERKREKHSSLRTSVINYSLNL